MPNRGIKRRSLMKRKRQLSLGLMALTGIWIGGCETTPATDDSAWLPTDGNVIEAKADRILRKMGDFLKENNQFTFTTKVTSDTVRETGHKIEHHGGAKIAIHKPNQIRADYQGDLRSTLSIYDGNTITIFDRMDDVYAITDAPPTIDEAVDFLVDNYGFSIPLADLFYADPYAILSEYTHAGYWAGLHTIEGTSCHHLAFIQDNIDWQIWIEDGPNPIPRRIVITYKSEIGSPQYTATLSDWNFKPSFAANKFEFNPPESADLIEFMRREEEVTYVEVEDEQ